MKQYLDPIPKNPNKLNTFQSKTKETQDLINTILFILENFGIPIDQTKSYSRSMEKMALSFYLDGRVSGVVGTHTHIQTADERILPGGTAHITDLGMTGSFNSMLGMKKEGIIETFLTTLPSKFVPDTSTPMVVCGVWIEVNTQTGKATKIQRVMIIDNDLTAGSEED